MIKYVDFVAHGQRKMYGMDLFYVVREAAFWADREVEE